MPSIARDISDRVRLDVAGTRHVVRNSLEQTVEDASWEAFCFQLRVCDLQLVQDCCLCLASAVC
eukprot:3108461-Rhodomonas_salina.1